MIRLHIASPLLKEGADPAVLERLRPLLYAVAPLAEAIRRRAQSGSLVGSQPHYKGQRVGYTVNREYASLAGVQTDRLSWVSSAAFHAVARRKPGQGVTGGMWAGYQARTYGSNAVVIDFAGSSLGRSSREVGKEFKDKRGKVRVQKKPQMIRNALKAGTYWSQFRVNLTQPDDRQQEALNAAVVTQAQFAVARAFGLPPPAEQPGGDAALYRQILRTWVTR